MTLQVEQRQQERVRYPAALRPQLVIDGIEWPVAEIAEGGIAFHCTDARFHVHQPFAGTLRFHDGAMQGIEGVILRVVDGLVIAACLTRCIAVERIRAEQQFLQAVFAAAHALSRTEQRRHERVTYPMDKQPMLLLDGAEWPVLELAQGGFIFRSADLRFRLRQPFAARVRFHDGHSVPVAGTILRMTRDEVIASCEGQMVPNARVERERYLLTQGSYPASVPSEHNVRRFPRLRYPDGQRPILHLNGREWPVIEISQGGLVFACTDLNYKLRQAFAGRVAFIDGGVQSVEGVILRMTRDFVIAVLTRLLPSARMEKEHRRHQPTS